MFEALISGRNAVVCASLCALTLGCDSGSTAPAAPEPDAPKPTMPAMDHAPGAGGFVVEPLARGSFPDQVDAMFRIKLDERTQVVNVRDPSDVFTARITFEPGGSVGWHTHPGPVIVTVASGELTIINASDCVHRPYGAGQAFIDPGQGNVHVGFNDTAGTTVIYATFLDVPPGSPASIPADDPGC
ncbi:MAG: cupin domain-containing protein [Longimicrobiales bacterium]